ncbi:putative nucleic acid-binding protein [Golovinomyces cichoracearum]|uniref:Putative nucleic acid-binding protein n=1 Tax=Golovinomyces cichoracearum TaxID=62708 RepID=A0A420ISW5_9PEZI|nr:putative nucleic acid-binding protein [Golovinomyces cichoracearum]
MLQLKPGDNVRISIDSFYKREVQAGQHVTNDLRSEPGDGFTETEIMNTLDPLSRDWDPDREYEKVAICRLNPGPKAVTFIGKIVNFSTRFGSSAEQPRAKGWHHLIIKDGTAALSMKLYFAVVPYPLQLGQLLTFWTAFVSEKLHNDTQQPISMTKISANMFPGRVISDHVLIHHSTSATDICRRPLEYQAGQELPLLTTLDSYLRSAQEEIKGIKILVVVKSISPIRKIKRNDSNEEYQLTDVGVMDNTAETRLTLWNELNPSARTWKPERTILLISNPGFRSPNPSISCSQGSLRILRDTMIEIDPDFRNADLLRQWAQSKIRRDSITWEFTEDEKDFEDFEGGTVRKFFTLAELDNCTCFNWNRTFTGFINVIIRNLNLHRMHRRNKLICGILLYSNSSVSECATCGKPVSLLPNANLVGQLLDETGCINGSSLIWSPSAWENLFGRPSEVVASWSREECTSFEQYLCFMRVHLCVGWRRVKMCPDERKNIGKLCVLGVQM